LKRSGSMLQSDLARYRAEEMLATSETVRSAAAACQVVDGDMTWLKLLAAAFTSAPGRIAVLVSKVTPAVAVVAASPDSGVAAHKLLSELIDRFGGRGGGKADLAQGGGLSGSPDAIVAAARTILSTQQPVT
jgi:alanyl-tRNA synthetase